MLVYVMAAEGIFEAFLNGWYYESPNNTLVSFQSSNLSSPQLLEPLALVFPATSSSSAKNVRYLIFAGSQVYWIKKHIFIKVWHSERVGILLYVIFAEILFWALVSGLLHQLGIYWKLQCAKLKADCKDSLWPPGIIFMVEIDIFIKEYIIFIVEFSVVGGVSALPPVCIPCQELLLCMLNRQKF